MNFSKLRRKLPPSFSEVVSRYKHLRIATSTVKFIHLKSGYQPGITEKAKGEPMQPRLLVAKVFFSFISCLWNADFGKLVNDDFSDI